MVVLERFRRVSKVLEDISISGLSDLQVHILRFGVSSEWKDMSSILAKSKIYKKVGKKTYSRNLDILRALRGLVSLGLVQRG